MNANERQVFAVVERAKIDKLFGDQAQSKINLARRLVTEVEAKRPGIFAFLERSGAGNSAAVVAMLANHAERLSRRTR
jgi:hypothetical protein